MVSSVSPARPASSPSSSSWAARSRTSSEAAASGTARSVSKPVISKRPPGAMRSRTSANNRDFPCPAGATISVASGRCSPTARGARATRSASSFVRPTKGVATPAAYTRASAIAATSNGTFLSGALPEAEIARRCEGGGHGTHTDARDAEGRRAHQRPPVSVDGQWHPTTTCSPIGRRGGDALDEGHQVRHASSARIRRA